MKLKIRNESLGMVPDNQTPVSYRSCWINLYYTWC